MKVIKDLDKTRVYESIDTRCGEVYQSLKNGLFYLRAQGAHMIDLDNGGIRPLEDCKGPWLHYGKAEVHLGPATG
jgi:hypothetical protein